CGGGGPRPPRRRRSVAELPVLDVVMLAFGDEPYLVEALDAVLASSGVDVRFVLVDNGCTRDDVDLVCADRGVTLLRPARNLGFTGGVNLGARQGTGQYL